MSKKLPSRENTALKLKGAGDGLRTPMHKQRSSDRIPVPSSRKFTATTPHYDPSVQLKLKKALDEMENKRPRLQKAKSVAEITPTKSRKRRSKPAEAGASTALLHATPRPMDEGLPPSGRDDAERRLGLLVYKRLLLLAWRRNKTRVAMVSESLRRRQEQIDNLEKQVNCLKELTQSECQRNNEATNHGKHLKKVLESLQVDHKALKEERITLMEDIKKLRENLENINIEVENCRNEVKTKSTQVKQLQEELEKERRCLRRQGEEFVAVNKKLQECEREKKTNEREVAELKLAAKLAGEQLASYQTAKKEQLQEFNRLLEQFHVEIAKNSCMTEELNGLYKAKLDMENRIDELEEKLETVNESRDEVLLENVSLKEDVEMLTKDRTCWWRNAKDFFIVSWAVLENAAYIMLPAL